MNGLKARWRAVAVAAVVAISATLLAAPAQANNSSDTVTHLNTDEGTIEIRTDKSNSTDWVIIQLHEHDWRNVAGTQQEGHMTFASGTPNNRVEVYSMQLQEKVGTGDWIVIESNTYNGTLWVPGDSVDTDTHHWGTCEPVAPNGVKYRAKIDYHIWWGSSWGGDEKVYASDAAYGQFPC